MRMNQNYFSVIDSRFDSAVRLGGLFHGKAAIDRHL
jgi:hypothetical protein